MEGPTTKADREFEAEAEKELTELMREVSEHDRRHGPRPRRLDQDISLVTAKLGALELQRRDLLADLDHVLSGEESEKPTPQDTAEADTKKFMREARCELDALIAATWGPQISGNRGKPGKKRASGK